MIIRELRETEFAKKCEISAIAFNYPIDMQKAKSEMLKNRIIGAFEDDGETIMSKIEVLDLKTSFYGEYIPTLGIVGIATKPEYRHSGHVRRLFSYLFSEISEDGWELSYLYPFSYNYYRQFGYERICDSLELELPISDLSFLPVSISVKPYTSTQLKDDILSIYFAYSADKNCLIYPDEKMYQSHVCDDPYGQNIYTYIWYGTDKKPGAYITFTINDGILRVSELLFADYSSLKGMLGFLRTFSGQAGSIKFNRVSTDSPLLLLLREFSSVKAELTFNSMGRILDAEKLLKRMKYRGNGSFAVKVCDSLEINNKIFCVEYENGSSCVTARHNGAYDAALSIQALTRIVLGTDNYDLNKASYFDGFEVKNPAGTERFLRAFPKHSISMLEHF